MQSFLFINILLIIILEGFSENVSNSTRMMSEGTCPENMLFFPINDNSINMICDCSIPGYLYFPETDSCYMAYTQGPCFSGHYLVLPPLENSAKCEKNPCLQEDLVPYKGSCGRLYQNGPPCTLRKTLSVDPETFEIKCISRSLRIIDAPFKPCPPGSRRISLGVCKHILE